MANIGFNISKGKLQYYFELPASNDAIKAIVLESSGLVSDDALADYDTISALLAGATNEQTTMGRKTLSSVTVTIDDSTNAVVFDALDLTWTGANGNPTGAIVLYYDPDTTASSDSNNIPLSKHDFITDPSGGDINVQIANLIRIE